MGWAVGLLIAGKLVYGGWRCWPATQQYAIQAFFFEAFRRSLAAGENESEPPDIWLVGSVTLGEPVGSLLQQWRQDRGGLAAAALGAFVKYWADSFHEGEPAPPLWQDLPPSRVEEVKTWLFSGDTRRQLEALPRLPIKALSALRGPDQCQPH